MCSTDKHFSISSAFAEENKKLEAVSNLDLQKFQGVWYEIAHNPWFPENNCFSMIADYKLIKDNEDRSYQYLSKKWV